MATRGCPSDKDEERSKSRTSVSPPSQRNLEQPTHSPASKPDEVVNDAAEQARSVVRLGSFAELVDDEQRAEGEVAEGEAVHDRAGVSTTRDFGRLEVKRRTPQTEEGGEVKAQEADVRDLLEVDHERRRALQNGYVSTGGESDS